MTKQRESEMRPVEEVAREMVPDAQYERVDWRIRIQDSDDYVPLEPQYDAASAQQIVEDARGILVRLVAQSRAEGVAAERERIVARLRRMAEGSEYIPNMSAWTTAAGVIESESVQEAKQ